MPRYIVEDDDVINHDELDEDAYEYVASADPPSKGRKRINADDKQEVNDFQGILFKHEPLSESVGYKRIIQIRSSTNVKAKIQGESHWSSSSLLW